MIVQKLELTIYAIDRDAVWPEKLCELFVKDKPLADAELWDVDIKTIPNYSVIGVSPTALRSGKSEIRGREWPTQYCDLFFQEKPCLNGEIRDTDTVVPSLHGVHVSATKGHFSVQNKSLVLSNVTIEDRNGTLHKRIPPA